MTKFSIRLVGEDSARIIETAGENESVEEIAREVAKQGYMLGKMKTSERLPEPQEVVVIASQIKWVATIASAARRDM